MAEWEQMEWELTDEEYESGDWNIDDIAEFERGVAQAQAKNLLEYIQGKFEPSNNRCAYTILEREWFELRRQVGL